MIIIIIVITVVKNLRDAIWNNILGIVNSSQNFSIFEISPSANSIFEGDFDVIIIYL